MVEFRLWLEFEAVEPASWNIENDFANIQVELPDGRRYGLNVWTYQFFETAIKQNKDESDCLNASYLIPPDLFVQVLTRDCIHKTIEDLLKKGNLEEVLNPSVLCDRWETAEN